MRSRINSVATIRALVVDSSGFSLTELMVVVVIIGVLAMIAVPRFLGVATRAKMTEAQVMLRQVHILQRAYFFERDGYTTDLDAIGFEQAPLISRGGAARYRISVTAADRRSFEAQAVSEVDFDGDGRFNVWTITESGVLRQEVVD